MHLVRVFIAFTTMKIVDIVSERVMVAEFLKAEIDSQRWRAHILNRLNKDGRPREVVDNPNLLDEAESSYRASLLAWRGYRNQDIFFRFPEVVQWHIISMTYGDLEETLVMNCAPWPKFSGATRLAGDASRNFKTGRINDDVLSHIKATSDLLKEGYALPKLILVGERLEGPLVILEGHVRAMAILGSDVNTEVRTIVGLSPDMRRWIFY
jgi:hypothetical protein